MSVTHHQANYVFIRYKVKRINKESHHPYINNSLFMVYGRKDYLENNLFYFPPACSVRLLKICLISPLVRVREDNPRTCTL